MSTEDPSLDGTEPVADREPEPPAAIAQPRRVPAAAEEPPTDTGKKRKAPKKARPWWIELPILIVIAFVLTFLIQTFIAKVYYVPSASMEQTLYGATSGGDRILVSKIVYDFREPRAGDVVVFSGPPNWTPEASFAPPSNIFSKAIAALGSVVGIEPPNEKDFVKRVIAVGGQTIHCCDAEGNVVVDGHSLHEPYIYQPLPFIPGQLDCTTTPISPRCFPPQKVPAGELWMMGDHRSDSADSSQGCRGQPAGVGAQCQGPVPVKNAIGKVIAIVMPPSRWGTIGAPDIYPSSVSAQAATSAIPVAGGMIGAIGLRGGFALLPVERRRRRRLRQTRRGAAGSGPGSRTGRHRGGTT